MPNMRAKFIVTGVEKVGDNENLSFSAVAKSGAYPDDGSDEDNSFARWSPAAHLAITVSNPALHGQFEVGQKYYADFTPAD